MKITGAKNNAAFVMAIVLISIITTFAQLPRPARARPAGAPRAVTIQPKQVDPDTKSADITPILEKIRALRMKAQPTATAAPRAVLPTATVPTTIAPAAAAPTATVRTRSPGVRTADFYLKNGKLIFGRLVADDKNKITVERLDGSNIISATYSKRDIDSRSIQIKNVPAARYYEELADYFAARTWDFKDDPDDFIQSIRAYERARRLITGKSAMDLERILEIGHKIANLEADREVWTKQIQSRAKLKELEFQAQFQTRFAELEQTIADSGLQAEDTVNQLNEILAEIQDNQKKLEQSIPLLEQDLRRRIDVLGNQMEINARRSDPYNTNFYRRRSYYGPGY